MNRTLVVFATVLVAAGVATALRPGAAVGPGPLRTAHASLENACFSCHAPFRGPDAVRCTICHAPGTIGVRSAADDAPLETPRAAVARLHDHLGAADCARCHGEHALPPAGDGARAFDHGILDAALRDDCVSCHRERRPADTLHGSAGDACARCHAPPHWKPSTFDHSAHFRFDRNHPPRCTDCHGPTLDLRTYSCTGCHEHAPSRMEEEHREEGITDLAACARCHRTGDEDDVLRTGDRTRGRDGGGDDGGEPGGDGGRRRGRGR